MQTFSHPPAKNPARRIPRTRHSIRIHQRRLFDRYKAVVTTGEPINHEFAVVEETVLSSWMRVQAVKLRDGIAITASDITERKRNEAHIVYLAQHDHPTGLPNRTLLNDRLEQAIAASKRSGTQAAVLSINLDGFKKVNASGYMPPDNSSLSLQRGAFTTHWNTSSRGTLKAWAIRNAASKDGEYFPASIAAIVCRVTPMRSPSSACDISPLWKRRMRIRFEIDPLIMLACGS